MSNKLKILGYLAGIILVLISSVLTAMLFESMATGTWLGIMFAIAGVCIDIGKIVTASATVYYIIKKRYGKALIPALLYLLAFGVSMVASQSLDLNKANIIRSENILSSDEYSFNKSNINNSDKDIERYIVDIKSLENSKQARIEQATSSLIAERTIAKSRRWYTTPVGSPRRGVDVINADISRVTSKTIEQVDYEISTLKNRIEEARKIQLKSQDNITTLKTDGGILATSGPLAFANWLNPSKPNVVLGWFYLFKNIFCEILGTYLLVFMKPNKKVKSAQDTMQAETQDELLKKRVKKKQIVEQTDITKEEIDLFIKFKKKYPNKGYKPISKLMGIAENKAGEIQIYLAENGRLKRNGNTYKVV